MIMTRSFGLTMEDLEEALSEILPPGFEIKVIKGKVVIATNLVENSYGDLIALDDLGEDDDNDDDDDDLDGTDSEFLDDDMDLSED